MALSLFFSQEQVSIEWPRSLARCLPCSSVKRPTHLCQSNVGLLVSSRSSGASGGDDRDRNGDGAGRITAPLDSLRAGHTIQLPHAVRS